MAVYLIQKAKEEVEKHLKTVELLSLKGDTHGQRDQIVNELLKAHARFLARIGEYRFLLNMAEKFFGNLDQVKLLQSCLPTQLKIEGFWFLVVVHKAKIILQVGIQQLRTKIKEGLLE